MKTDATRSSPRPIPGGLLGAYIAATTLVLCHEMDSARWGEWDLFHLPGGGALFVGLHLILVPVVLLGLVSIARGATSGRCYALFLGAAGTIGAVVHGLFLVAGDPRFSTPFSIALIIAFGLSSLLLVVVAAGGRRAIASTLGAGPD